MLRELFRFGSVRSRWAAVGAAIAVSMGASGLAFVHAADSSNSAVFHPLSPVRVFDTRTGAGGVPVTPLGPKSVLDVQMTGVNGVPSNATAIVLNVTVVDGTGPSFLTVWPTGDSMPLASSLNWTGGDATPNGVTVPIGVGGKVSFYNPSGHVNVLADVSGYYTAAEQPPFTQIANQTIDARELPESIAVISSVSLTLPDVCPGPDHWTVQVLNTGFLSTGGDSGGVQQEAELALSTSPTEITNLHAQFVTFASNLTGHASAPFSMALLYVVDSGTRTFYEWGKSRHPAGVTTDKNALIAESVSVSC